MRINTNLTAMNTYTQYTKNQTKISGAVAKLSSGYAINSAADNAAGLAISEKMRAQIRGLDKASSNAQDAISLVQTAEGALDSSTEILQRMREIAVQSASDTNENEIDRAALQDEFSQLQSELNDIAKNTTFNKKNLLDGSLASTKTTVDITNLTNATTAVSVGKAAAGNYSFSVSVKQETSAVSSADATGAAALGTTATATIDTATVAMGANSADTALYNGNYTLSAAVDEATASVTVTATGDNGQTFTSMLEKAYIDNQSSLEFNFETAANAGDAFKMTLNLKEPTDADSINALQTLATAIDDVTVSVDGGVDAVAATYGVYANVTGAKSVKLNANDSSVTFNNSVTVSFDQLTATDVAVDAQSSQVLTPTDEATTIVDGGGAAHSSISIDLSANFAGLTTGNEFAVKIGDNVYTGTYRGETGSDLDDLIATTLADVTAADDNAGVYSLTVSAGVATWETNANNNPTAFTLDGNTVVDAGTAVVDFCAPASTADNVTYTLGTATTAASFATANVTAQWSGATTGDTVYYQLGDTVYSGAFDTNATTTIANLLNGKSYTDSNNVTYSFTGAAAGVATFTATTVGVTTDPANIAGNGSLVATGNSATLSDGLVSKLGKTTDEGTTSTTATTFTVNVKANKGVTFQVGANEGDEMTINIDKMDSRTLGVNSAKVASGESAKVAIDAVDAALNKVSAMRANLGAVQNRLEYKIDNLNTSSTNLTSAESQIRDVDMAKEMTDFTNANILSQAATAMLAQANSLPQSVLSLIKG